MKYSVGSTGSPGDSSTTAFGTAQWMLPDEAEALNLFNYNSNSIVLGKNSKDELAFLNRQGHIIVVAPPRSGKGVGFVQSNLIAYQGSVVVTDPKGENAAVTFRHRQERLGHKVIILDPAEKLKSYRIEPPIQTHCFNPLSVLENSNYVEIVDDIERLADALLVQKDSDRDQHWRDGAKSLIKGLLAFLAFYVEPKKRNLVTLARLANGVEAPLEDIFLALVHNSHPEPLMKDILARLGSWYGSVHEKERSSFISMALRSLSWLNSPVWNTHLASSDFHPYDLKAGKTSLYIVCPFDKLEDYSPWFRLVLSSCLVAHMRAPKGSENPTLFMLDEYAATIGKFATLENSIPYIEGVGGRVAMIFQTLSQMQSIWPGNEFHGMFASAGAHIFFNVGDQFTADHVSKFIGTHDHMAPSGGGLTKVRRELLMPDEVLRHPENDMIVLLRGYRPAWLSKVDVRFHRAFSGQLDDNPAYKVLPALASKPVAGTMPVLSMSQALAKAKGQRGDELQKVLDLLDAKYPHREFRFEGDFYGFDETIRNSLTGQIEKVFTPVLLAEFMAQMRD